MRSLPEKTPLDIWIPDLAPKHYLRVANGILDLDSSVLRPHSPNWLSLVSLPVAYDPDSSPPKKWLKFLTEVQEGDQARIDLLQEISGCCLDRQLVPDWFAFLTGDGDNGKSAFLRVLKFILGDRNCSSVNLFDLANGGNRFARFDLFGKLANLKGDQSYFESEEESALKELTGGDLVAFENKYQSPIYAVNTAKLVFACNQLPTFKDKTRGIWRRFVPVPFNWIVPAELRNAQLDTTAYWREELPGILNWMLEGLRRYRGRGENFAIPQVCRDLIDQHKQDSNPAAEFLLNHYSFTGSANDVVTSKELFEDYRNWCLRNNVNRPLRNSVFGREVVRAFPKSSPIRTTPSGGGEVRGRTGIRRVSSIAVGPFAPS